MNQGSVRYLALCLACLSGFAVAATDHYDPRTYGAAGDGIALDTQAIQRAVDACTAAGGGTVRLEAGTYLSGIVRLKDKVTLFIAADATLLGSTNILDYPPIQPALRSYTDRYVDKSLIYAEGASNIAVAGPGTINGQGEHFRSVRGRNLINVNVKVADGKPQTFENCENVHEQGVETNP